MKVIITGDWHYSAYSSEGKVIQNYPEKLYYLDRTHRNICEYAIKNEIKYIIVLGDIYHTKSIIYTLAQDMLMNLVRNYRDKVHFIFLQGNHDLSSRSEISSSTLEGFRSEPNVIVITETTTLPLKDLFGSHDSIFVPYTHNIVNEVKSNSGKNLFSHFGLNEGVLNSGISVVSDIKLSELKGKYENVFIGHYHSPQEIIDNDIKLWYVGSSIQLDIGEKNEDKRFLVFNTINNTVESIPTQGYKKLYEYLITEENKQQVIEEAKLHKEEGHNVRFVKKEKVDTDDLKKDFIVIDKTEKDIMNRGLSSAMNEREKLARYVEIQKIKEELKEPLINAGLEFINRAKVRMAK